MAGYERQEKTARRRSFLCGFAQDPKSCGKLLEGYQPGPEGRPGTGFGILGRMGALQLLDSVEEIGGSEVFHLVGLLNWQLSEPIPFPSDRRIDLGPPLPSFASSRSAPYRPVRTMRQRPGDSRLGSIAA